MFQASITFIISVIEQISCQPAPKNR